jgi:hypothetical protein
MSKRSVRVLALFALLGAASPSATADREHDRNDPPSPACHCTGLGINCFFGSAAPCSVECFPPANCECWGATCLYGFPLPSVCRCV